jgi:flavin-dependent dehydrogenase
LIGADGSLSLVRRKMNLNNANNLSPTLEVFAQNNPKIDQEHNSKKITIDLNCIDSDVQGYIWHVPSIIENKQYIGHGMAHFRLHKDKPKPNMKKIFEKVLLSRNIQIDQKNWLSHPIRWPSENDVISKPNVFLIGDAVGIEPAFGGGIHFALSYGELAAFTLMDAFENNNFSFKDYKERYNSHLVGKFIKKCHRVASEMYDNKLHPLDGAKEVFTVK